MILETVMGVELASYPGPLSVLQDCAGCRGKIGSGRLEKAGVHAFRREQAAEGFLYEIADILRRDVPAEDASYAGLVGDIERLFAIGAAIFRPIARRQGISRGYGAPVRRVIVIIHSTSPTGRTEGR
ncbi:hypothetical protein [Sphingopyxis sp. Geo25]|nr:hypothetical protein [Sphingopyxis sp. Geo25]